MKLALAVLILLVPTRVWGCSLVPEIVGDNCIACGSAPSVVLEGSVIDVGGDGASRTIMAGLTTNAYRVLGQNATFTSTDWFEGPSWPDEISVSTDADTPAGSSGRFVQVDGLYRICLAVKLQVASSSIEYVMIRTAAPSPDTAFIHSTYPVDAGGLGGYSNCFLTPMTSGVEVRTFLSGNSGSTDWCGTPLDNAQSPCFVSVTLVSASS